MGVVKYLEMWLKYFVRTPSSRMDKIYTILFVCNFILASNFNNAFKVYRPTNNTRFLDIVDDSRISRIELYMAQKLVDTPSIDDYKKDKDDTLGIVTRSTEPLEELIGNVKPVVIEVEELRTRWNKIQKLNNKDTFSVIDALPQILNDNKYIALVNKTEEVLESSSVKNDNDIIYVTEQELENLWHEKSVEPMAQSMAAFDCKSALLLLEDEDDYLYSGSSQSSAEVLDKTILGQIQRYNEMKQESSNSIVLDFDSIKSKKKLEKTVFNVEEIDEGIEFVITEEVRHD